MDHPHELGGFAVGSRGPLALDVVIVGGCGHVGLPLALSLAETGYRVGIDDIDAAKIDRVRAGDVPFRENGAEGGKEIG